MALCCSKERCIHVGGCVHAKSPVVDLERFRGDRDSMGGGDWFDVMLETSPTAMGVISALEGRYVRANQPLADMFGMTVEEVLSCDPYALAQRITHPDELVAEQK